MTTRKGNGHFAVIGMFDGVHTGHRYLLGELKKLAASKGLSPLAITFSNHPLELIAPEKAPQLLTTTTEKLRLINEENVNGIAIPFDHKLRCTSAMDFLHLLHDRYGVEALLMGYNNRFGHNAPKGFDEYRNMGEQCNIDIIPAKEYTPKAAERGECGRCRQAPRTSIRTVWHRGKRQTARSPPRIPHSQPASVRPASTGANGWSVCYDSFRPPGNDQHRDTPHCGQHRRNHY